MSKYDWDAIRAMWEAGDAATAIAKKPGMPTKQAICQKQAREGWERVDAIDPELEVIPFDRLSHQQAIVVTKMAKGLPQKWAAAYAGVSEDTVTRWKKTPDFAVALQAAQAVFVDKQLGKVSESTDWRSGLALMERHPTMRGDFKPPQGNFIAPTFNVLGQVQVGISRHDNLGLSSSGHEPALIDASRDGDEQGGESGSGGQLVEGPQ